jgi:hypothetical protein
MLLGRSLLMMLLMMLLLLLELLLLLLELLLLLWFHHKRRPSTHNETNKNRYEYTQHWNPSNRSCSNYTIATNQEHQSWQNMTNK